MKYSIKKSITFLPFALLLLGQSLFAQCKMESNPNKWLYKNGLGRYKVSYPQKVDRSTKITKFFDAFVFLSLYSFVRAGEDRMFYLQFWGPASYPYDVNETDSIEFCFHDNQIWKLAPQTNYPGEKGALIAFFKLNSQFLDKMASTDLDSIVLQFTPHPVKKQDDESKLLHSYTFRKFSTKNVGLFKKYAACFRKEF